MERHDAAAGGTDADGLTKRRRSARARRSAFTQMDADVNRDRREWAFLPSSSAHAASRRCHPERAERVEGSLSMTVRPEERELPRTSYCSMEILRSLRSLRKTGGVVFQVTAGVAIQVDSRCCHSEMTAAVVIPSAARNLRQAARMRFLDSLRSLGMTKGGGALARNDTGKSFARSASQARRLRSRSGRMTRLYRPPAARSTSAHGAMPPWPPTRRSTARPRARTIAATSALPVLGSGFGPGERTSTT